MSDRMYPCLPSGDVDASVAFYEALGFATTYRQRRPQQYAVVARGDLALHLFGMDGFDPASSYACAIVVVSDPDALYTAFATGLRAAFGKLPASGVPRILRPRKKFGTVQGFSVVDPGGNWLRFYRDGDTEVAAKTPGLAGLLEVAARLGDAKGDDAQALRTLESGIARLPDAPPADRCRALLYCAELALRLGDRPHAERSFAAARAIEADNVADEIEHVEQLLAERADDT